MLHWWNRWGLVHQFETLTRPYTYMKYAFNTHTKCAFFSSSGIFDEPDKCFCKCACLFEYLITTVICFAYCKYGYLFVIGCWLVIWDLAALCREIKNHRSDYILLSKYLNRGFSSQLNDVHFITLEWIWGVVEWLIRLKWVAAFGDSHENDRVLSDGKRGLLCESSLRAIEFAYLKNRGCK